MVSCVSFPGKEALNLGFGVEPVSEAGYWAQETAVVQTPQGGLAET